MTKATKYSVDIEEVLGGDIGQPALEFNIVCPRILGPTKKTSANNWSLEQCDLRVRISSPCTFDCKYGKMIRERYEDAGIDYLEPEDYVQKVYTEKELNSKKGKHKKNPSMYGDWGKISLLERNMNMVMDILDGKDYDAVADEYCVTLHVLRAKVILYCKLANIEVYKQYSGLPTKTIEYLRKNKKLFIDNFPKMEDVYG